MIKNKTTGARLAGESSIRKKTICGSRRGCRYQSDDSLFRRLPLDVSSSSTRIVRSISDR